MAASWSARSLRHLLAGSAAGCLMVAMAHAQDGDGTVLPYPDPQFTGQLGETTAQSAPPQFVPVRKPPAGAPNIFLIMTDDVGFGAASAFGGPVPTPNLERLAGDGLRYNNFHVTGVCSPSRAALLTGRNAHAVGTGIVMEVATGYPGYVSVLPKSAATMAQVLRLNGYSTAMFGKHHNTPRWLSSPAGPFDTWPTGLGFDHFYGFIGGDSDQYQPTLIQDNTVLPTPSDPAYILDRDLADHAISWIHGQKAGAPDRPFMIYYAPGTLHAPHQAPQAWIARFKGRFDKGWDAVRAETVARQKAAKIVPAGTSVTPRPADIAAWASLSDQQRRIYARMMEVAAGTLAYQDDQIGRILAELRRMGEYDNTLVVFIEGDNGASAEGGVDGFTNEMGKLGNGVPEGLDYLDAVSGELGGPGHHNNYPAGWAWAMDAPFPFFKQIASHLGATQDGMVISWPAGIAARGEVRNQFHHLVDIYPTLLDAAGVKVPIRVNGIDQQPLDGVSLRYSFSAQGARMPSPHHTQYFEIRGNRAIYSDGWWANTTPGTMPWSGKRRPGMEDGKARWELYDLRTDFAQARDLAATNPAKLAQMQTLWVEEARRNHVLPIQEEAGPDRFLANIRNYGFNRPRSVFWGPLGLPEGAAPSLQSTSFTVTADVELPEKAQGVILASGGRFGGWSFYCKDGEIVAFNALSQQARHHYRVSAPLGGAVGPSSITFRFDMDRGEGFGRGGVMHVLLNGKELSAAHMERTGVVPQNSEEFNIGYDNGTPVSPEYKDRFPFNGVIGKVVVERR